MTIAEDTADDGSLKLVRASPGFALVFDGYRGMETSIHFDTCEVHDDCIGLYIGDGDIVGEIFTDEKFDNSNVASALRAIQHNNLTVET